MSTDAASVGQVLQVITSLIFVVAIIFVGAWFFRRYGRISGLLNEDLKVVAGLSVGQREKVIVLQTGKTQLLLGVSPGRIQTLHVFDVPVIKGKQDEASAKVGDRFTDCLKHEIKKKILPSK